MTTTPWQTTIENLSAIEEALLTANREGKVKDDPEGSRFILVSDTLAKRWVTSIGMAKKIITDEMT